MWKHIPTNASVRPGKGWTDEDGIQHPGNWHVWSIEEKATRGLVEITPETPPDSRLYHWGQNPDGTITKTAKPIEDIRERLIGEVSQQQRSLLSETDWVFIRQMDSNKPVPVAIKQHRDAIRGAHDDAVALIEAVTTVEEAVLLPKIVWPKEVE